jgi:hypothetical protein
VPKRLKYSPAAFQARLRLAALDHNLNTGRPQAITKDGRSRFKLQYSKAAKDYIIKERLESKVYDFRTELLFGVLSSCTEGTEGKGA